VNSERVEEREKSGDFVDTIVALDSIDGAVEIDNAGEFVVVILAALISDGNALTDDESVAYEAVATTLCIASGEVEAISLLIPVPVDEDDITNDNDDNTDVLDDAEEMGEPL
jgi:hypothetical protein